MIVGPVIPVQRRLPAPAAPRQDGAAQSAADPRAMRLGTDAPGRPAVWTLARETASAACVTQMAAPARRGLKADAAERARYAAAYRPAYAVKTGLARAVTA